MAHSGSLPVLVTSRNDLEQVIQKNGILPFFHQEPLPCLEEMAAPDIWFTEKEGPWEWKGILAHEKKCVYGKTISSGAAFIAMDAFPELIRIRRDGYDFEGMWEDGLLSRTAGNMMKIILQEGPILSRHLRRKLGCPKDFDRELIHLQMLTFLVHTDFLYDLDQHGHPYGWGNALLDTPEHFYGEDYVNAADAHSVDESLEILCRRIRMDSPEVRLLLSGKRKKTKRSRKQ